MSLPRYSRYKPSGIEWLGTIPMNWDAKRLKWLLACNDGGVWGADTEDDEGTIVLRSTEQTVDGRWQLDDPARRNLTEAERASALLEPGDLLVTKSSGSALHIGKTTLVDKDVAALGCCYSNFMQRIRAHAIFIPKLLWYVLNNELARTQFDIESNSTTGLANLNGTIIGNLILPVPPNEDQQAIVRFLDRETAKIDALVSEQERLIALLKEKRQAVISHAVTKGFNSGVPMKRSGIEWLDDVPEHWDVARLKSVALVQTGVAKGKDYRNIETVAVPYLRVANVQDGYLDLSEVAEIEMPVDDVPRYELKTGDVLMNEGGDFDKLGRGAIWHGEIAGCIHQNHVFAVRPHGVRSEWLNAVTSSDYAQFYFMGRSKQSTNLASISSSNLMELPVVLPPDAEQDMILERIEDESKHIEDLIGEAERGTALLRERRSALISAAITGQFDVRNTA